MVEKQRIKGFYQKPYTTFHPFGTDGQLIDMLSGLNLQEQLKIGLIPDNFQIIENESYFSVIQSFNDKDGNLAYTLVTTTTQLTNEILAALQEENDTPVFNVITASSYNGLAVQEISQSNVGQATVITVSLYKGEYDPQISTNLITSKVIIIPEVV